MNTRIYYCVCDMATRKSKRGLQLYLIKDADGNFTLPYRDFLSTESVASASIPKARRLLQTGFCNAEQVRFSDQPVVLWQNIQMYLVNVGNATVREYSEDRPAWRKFSYQDALAQVENASPLMHGMVYPMLTSVALTEGLRLVSDKAARLGRTPQDRNQLDMPGMDGMCCRPGNGEVQT